MTRFGLVSQEANRESCSLAGLGVNVPGCRWLSVLTVRKPLLIGFLVVTSTCVRRQMRNWTLWAVICLTFVAATAAQKFEVTGFFGGQTNGE
jgi:hypothetical protein